MAQKFTVPIVVRNLSASSSDALAVSVDGDTHDRIKFEAGGRIVWGTGASAGDVNLYRPSADLLKTDDAFQAAGVITLTSDGPPTAALPDGALAVDTTNETLYVRANNAWVVASGGGGASVTVSDTAPLDPEQGDLWFESDTGDIYVYYSSTWVDIGGSSVANIAVTTTPPSSPVNGDLWFDTDTAKTYVYYNDGTSGQWVEIGAASAAASGTDGAVQFASGGAFSSDAVNFVWDDTNNRIGIGTASPASTLSVTGVNSETRPLLDLQASLAPGESSAYQRGIRLLNSGMSVGDELMMCVGRSDNTRNQGQMYFQYSGDGSTSNRLSLGLFAVDDVLNVMGSGNVGIGTTTPSYKLDVNGDINASGSLRVGGTAVGKWTSFTPTWTAATTNPSIGNGTLRGRYMRVANLVIAQYDLRMGSTTTFGSGIWYMSFPVPATFVNMFSYMDLGVGRLYDASAQTVYNLHCIGFNADTTKFRLLTDGPQPHNLSVSDPFTWSTSDEVLFTIWYEAA